MLPLVRRHQPAPSIPPIGANALFFGESTFEATNPGGGFNGPVVSSILCARFGWKNLNTGNYSYWIPETISGGTYTITVSVNGGTSQTTASIAWNDTAATVQTRLTALTNIGSGNLLVTSGGLPGAHGRSFTLSPVAGLVTSGGGAAALAITLNTGSLTPGVIFSQLYMFTIPNTVTSGNYTITWSGQTTGNIAWNANPNDGTAGSITSKLAALSNIGTGNVRVTGFGLGTPNVVIFQGALGTNQPAPTINLGTLSPAPATPVASPFVVYVSTDPQSRAAVGSTTLQTHATWSSTDTRPDVTGAGAVAARVTQFNADVVVIWYCANEYLNTTSSGAAIPITLAGYTTALDTVLTAINAQASKPVVVIAGMQPIDFVTFPANKITGPDWCNFPGDTTGLGARDVLDQYDEALRAKAQQYGARYVYLRDMPQAFLAADGVHPSLAVGYPWVADRIAGAFTLAYQ